MQGAVMSGTYGASEPSQFPGPGVGAGPMWTAGPDPARRSPRSAAKIAAAAVGAAVVVAAGVGSGHGLWPKGSSSNPSLSVGGTPSATGKANSGTSGSGSGGLSGSAPASAGPTAVASTVSLGLVDINTTIDYGEAQAAGTGMVLTSSGEVLTNNHVIEGATSISVTDIGNGNTYSATVVGYDRNDDVAVLQLQ